MSLNEDQPQFELVDDADKRNQAAAIQNTSAGRDSAEDAERVPEDDQDGTDGPKRK